MADLESAKQVCEGIEYFKNNDTHLLPRYVEMTKKYLHYYTPRQQAKIKKALGTL